MAGYGRGLILVCCGSYGAVPAQEGEVLACFFICILVKILFFFFLNYYLILNMLTNPFKEGQVSNFLNY